MGTRGCGGNVGLMQNMVQEFGFLKAFKWMHQPGIEPGVHRGYDVTITLALINANFKKKIWAFFKPYNKIH